MNSSNPNPNPTDVENGAFAIDDDDECVIEDDDDDDDEDFGDEEAHRTAIDSILGGSGINNGINNNDKYSDDDRYNTNIHDQLPSVEEVKASNAYLPTALLLAKSHRRKLYLIVAAAGFAAVVLSVFISLGVFARSGRSKSNTTGNGNGATNNRLQSILDEMSGISYLPRLEDPHSPEYHAAQFLAGGDSKHLDFENKEVAWRTTQRYILAVLFYATRGDSWDARFNFMSNDDHCQWHTKMVTPAGPVLKGVQCDERGSVVDLDLSNNNLVAKEIPEEIVYLHDLKRLHLFGNSLNGKLPPAFNSLAKLESVGLHQAGLVGTIPSYFGTMAALTTLALGQNKFTGTIPASFAKATAMRILGLDGNGLEGWIEPLLHLSNLQALYLEDNHLKGEIKTNSWTDLRELDVSNNLLDGRLPDDIFTKNPHLQVFDANNNAFFGEFPHDIRHNDNVEYVSVFRNSFSGTISDHVGFWPGLKHLDVAGNHFSGTLPDTVQLLTNLVSISTSGNNFDPKPLQDIVLTQLTKLQDLSMKGNKLFGTIPAELSLLTHLRMMDLDGNQLTGTITTYLGTMDHLAILQLNRNQLTGTIPSELSRLARLQILLLDGNNLIGQTDGFCSSSKKQSLSHFTADCYPGPNGAQPEVDCRCCSLCCNDENTDCNNKDWTASYDPKSMYGYIRPAYDFSLDKAQPGWMKKMQQEATLGEDNLPIQGISVAAF